MNQAEARELCHRLGLVWGTLVARTAIHLAECGWTPTETDKGWRWQHPSRGSRAPTWLTMADAIQEERDRTDGRRAER